MEDFYFCELCNEKHNMYKTAPVKLDCGKQVCQTEFGRYLYRLEHFFKPEIKCPACETMLPSCMFADENGIYNVAWYNQWILTMVGIAFDFLYFSINLVFPVVLFVFSIYLLLNFWSVCVRTITSSDDFCFDHLDRIMSFLNHELFGKMFGAFEFKIAFEFKVLVSMILEIGFIAFIWLLRWVISDKMHSFRRKCRHLIRTKLSLYYSPYFIFV